MKSHQLAHLPILLSSHLLISLSFSSDISREFPASLPRQSKTRHRGGANGRGRQARARRARVSGRCLRQQPGGRWSDVCSCRRDECRHPEPYRTVHAVQ
ncbi:hypothetical protein IWZ03DRAFT_369359 [Phyllosticta citriasiana]|uniref:Secreted protein n=1 Tax=Phyllosticta citriasiana TaxID=595635 RepID=A0ABR1KVS9_9PEZI